MAQQEIVLKLNKVSIEYRRGDYQTRAVPHNMNHRMHWAVKSKWNQAWREEVYYTFLNIQELFPKLPLKFPTINVKFYHTHLMDFDNLHNSAKILIDALKMQGKKGTPVLCCGIIEDDGPDKVTIKVEQEKVKFKDNERSEIRILF